MEFKISYLCCSHKGNVRSINQDNFICNKEYMMDTSATVPLFQGSVYNISPALFGVFDGLGGEESGETAALIAAKLASGSVISNNPLKDLDHFCSKANREICDYAKEHSIRSMGTTAALLAFTEEQITLCNIGDSKVLRFAEGELEQISTDHYALAEFGRKPPLLQNLGIPETEMIIQPYFAIGSYNDGDIYLICSDGLTDMVSMEDIKKVVSEASFDEIPGILQEMALANGGLDNITMILCKIEKRKNIFNSIFTFNKE